MSDFNLSSFVASFFDEAKERLSSINQNLVAFESGSLGEEELNRLRRDAHTIKGSALMLGVNDVGEMAHLFEDAMETLIKHPEMQTPKIVQFLFNVHDLLAERLEHQDTPDLLDAKASRNEFEVLCKTIEAEATSSDLPGTEAQQEIVAETKAEPAEEVAIIGAEEAKAWKDSASEPDLSQQELPQEHADQEEISLDEISLEQEAQEEISLDEISLEQEAEEQEAQEEISLDQISLEQAVDVQVDQEEISLDEISLEQEAQDQLDQVQVPQQVSATAEASMTDQNKAEEAPAPDHAEMVFAAENASNFRPDISKLEMKALGTRQSSGRYLRVDADRLDKLSNQVMDLSIEKSRGSGMVDKYSELARSMRELRRHWQQLQAQLTTSQSRTEANLDKECKELDELFDLHLRDVQYFGNDMRYEQDKAAIVLNDIRDQILGLMVRPLDSVFSTFPRAVRDIAVRLGRKVQLQVGGKSVEMDLGVSEALGEPLIHLINNAIAHGIESPEERLKAGKPEAGMISILAQQNGSEVNIEIVDDGRGIDVERVKAAAIRRGVTTHFEANQMDSVEILEMIFRPGFTTHEDVDKLAGRGMGMNVVQDTVRKLTGSVRIHTEVGKGTRFLLSLPVSIAVQHSLQFRIGDLHFGMLTHMIEQILPLDKLEKIADEGDSPGKEKATIARYGKHQMPLVDLRNILRKKRSSESSQPYVVIAEHIEGYVGIVVDELFEESEIIVRDIDPYLKRYQAPGLMGNTIDQDGSVLLLIEPYGIKEMGRTAPEQSLQEEYASLQKDQAEASEVGGDVVQDEAFAGPEKPKVLLVEDSLIAREIEKAMLQSSGFSVRTAIDGIDAMDKVHSESFDLIVTDLEMPRLDGFGLVRQIRNESRLDDMPIMVISTRESAEDRMRAMDAGADAYLVKQQLSHEGLRSTLEKFFGSLTGEDDSNTNRPVENAPIV